MTTTAAIRSKRKKLVAEIRTRMQTLGILQEASKQRKIQQLLAHAESTTFPAEAETARRLAKKLMKGK